MVHRRADDDHRLALRLFRVLGELPGDGDDLLSWYAGDPLLPRGRVRRVVVETLGGALSRESARDAVVRDLQIEHGGDQRLALFAVVADSDARNRHRPDQHVSAGIVREVHVLDAAEVREAHTRGFARCCCTVSHRQLELDVASPLRFLRLEVPLALIGAAVGTPAESDCTIRQHDVAVFVESDGLPIGIVGLAEVAVEIGRTHVTVGDED